MGKKSAQKAQPQARKLAMQFASEKTPEQGKKTESRVSALADAQQAKVDAAGTARAAKLQQAAEEARAAKEEEKLTRRQQIDQLPQLRRLGDGRDMAACKLQRGEWQDGRAGCRAQSDNAQHSERSVRPSTSAAEHAHTNHGSRLSTPLSQHDAHSPHSCRLVERTRPVHAPRGHLRTLRRKGS